jgi:hypothetical protein
MVPVARGPARSFVLVSPWLFSLFRVLTRRAALDDLSVALPAARFAIRLLFVAARDQQARDAALEAAAALDHARALIGKLR